MGFFSTLGGLASFIPGIGPIAGGVLSGVGSLIDGKKAQKEQERYNNALANAGKTDLVALRKEAEEAGFNPLTVLNATGGAGFGAQQVGPPPLASTEVLARSIGAGVQTYNEIQAATLQRQLEYSTRNISGFRYDYPQKGANSYGQFSPLSSANVYRDYGPDTRGPSQSTSMTQPAGGYARPADKGMLINGYKFDYDQNTSDVETLENRYGELVAEPYGVYSFGNDMKMNNRKKGEGNVTFSNKQLDAVIGVPIFTTAHNLGKSLGIHDLVDKVREKKTKTYAKPKPLTDFFGKRAPKTWAEMGPSYR